MTDAEAQALNIAIATKLGYTDVHLQGRGVELRLVGTLKGSHNWLPDFAHSLDAVADALPASADMHIHSTLEEAGQIWYVANWTDSQFDYATGATRQEAAATALLAWLEAKGK